MTREGEDASDDMRTGEDEIPRRVGIDTFIRAATTSGYRAKFIAQHACLIRALWRLPPGRRKCSGEMTSPIKTASTTSLASMRSLSWQVPEELVGVAADPHDCVETTFSFGVHSRSRHTMARPA